MRILYVAQAHDYGRPELGPSLEEVNFATALEGMEHELVRFDFKERELAVGRAAMNEELIAVAGSSDPDLAFFVLYENELHPSTIRSVGRNAGAPTVNWFADDHWRFEDFTRHYAQAFDWSVTTDHAALARYGRLGYRNVILSQWACNPHSYRPTSTHLSRDVGFVGLPHGDRPETIEALRGAGYEVECHGAGWPAGRLSHDDMVRFFGETRVNLSFTDGSRAMLPRLAGLLARGNPGTAHLLRRAFAGEAPRQIKTRTFEVPACGGFLLTQRAPHIEDYFEPGREIGVFDGRDELVEQVRWWLDHPDERAAAASAAHRRALAEHTYERRFEEIFRAVGLA